jgi:hypothetical protein
LNPLEQSEITRMHRVRQEKACFLENSVIREAFRFSPWRSIGLQAFTFLKDDLKMGRWFPFDGIMIIALIILLYFFWVYVKLLGSSFLVPGILKSNEVFRLYMRIPLFHLSLR